MSTYKFKTEAFSLILGLCFCIIFLPTTSFTQDKKNLQFIESAEDSVFIAFYCEYYPRMGHLHLSEESTVIDWLKNNWGNINSFGPQQSRGPYCPPNKNCSHYGLCPASNLKKIGGKANFPKSVKELLASDKVVMGGVAPALGNEHLFEAKTDDDEVFMNWMVFDKKYKEENFNKVALFFYDELPTNFGKVGVDIDVPSTDSLKGTGEGNTYIIPSIYDLAFDYDYVFKIEGVRVPELADFIRSQDTTYSKYSEMYYLQKCLNDNPQLSLEESLEKLVQLDVENLNRLPQKSTVTSSTHMVDVVGELWHMNYQNVREEFRTSVFQHWLIFDDLWIAENKDLAESIINMRINQSLITKK